MQYGYIYKTTNLINGKIYIGQKGGLINHHYLGSGNMIKDAIKKYGKKNFRIEVLAYATTKAMLDGLEMKHIFEYRQVYGKEFLYNIADGGCTFLKGLKKTNESNQMRSISVKKAWINGLFNHRKIIRILTPEYRNKISESRKGQRISAETKNKMSLAHKGRNFSEEHKRKLSEATKRHYQMRKENVQNSAYT